jgi:NhaP-type Na+/H+ or K+/H+ antiporter
LTRNDKLFISWVGPRGIVAAGIASLFGLKLVQKGFPGAEYITPLVFMVVLGTVLLNATTAGIIAKMLKVLIDKSTGILILGAHRAAQLIGMYLHENNKRVVLIDSNPSHVRKAEELGLEALKIDIYHDELNSYLELNDMGYFMALTGSTDVNAYAMNELKSEFGENGAYRLITISELREPELIGPNALFSKYDDYINLSEVARDYPNIEVVEIKNQNHLDQLILASNEDDKVVPLFVHALSTDIKFINPVKQTFSFEEGDKFVYLGRKMADIV